MTRLIIITLVTVIFLSCNNENTVNKSDENNDSISKKETIEKVVKKEVKLINIPAKINEETKRTLFSDGIIAIDVFDANITMNEGTNILSKMFPTSEIKNAETSEVFDSFKVSKNDKNYCGIITYGQNENEEFVIKTIFIAEGFFSEKIINTIYK